MSGASGLRKHDHSSAGQGGTGAVGTPSDILSVPTAETDATLVLAPDGAGGVEFRAESGGSGVDIDDDAALIAGVNFADGSDPASPAAGHHIVYAKSGGVYVKDSAASVVGPFGTVPQALGTGDSPQFLALNVGHASDTTLARASAGNLTVEGNALYRAGGTDVAIADGGTGASTQAAAFDALSPMTTAGDIIIGGASGTGTRLAAGTSTHVLTSNGAGVAPSYQAVAGTGTVTTVKDEGSNLSTAVTSIDFVGAGVTATGTTAVTVTIPGGSGSVASDTIFDAKGDLPVGTGADTAAKLTVGANGTRPEAASGETTGIKWSYPPGYELDYVEITTGVSISATTEGTANTCITGTSQAYAAVPTLIEVFCPRLNAGATVIVLLFDGGTVIGRLGLVAFVGISTFQGSYRLTPSAATHQYIVKAYNSSSSSTFDCGAGGTGTEVPAFLRITKV